MKVRCIKLLDGDGHEVEYTPWFQLGKIYQVMGISVDIKNQKTYYLVISNYDYPGRGMMMSEYGSAFEVVSNNVPSNWKIKIYQETHYLEILPAAWFDNNFLERFYDRDPETFPIFERERDLIMNEDPL